jgi:hypothetical protein
MAAAAERVVNGPSGVPTGFSAGLLTWRGGDGGWMTPDDISAGFLALTRGGVVCSVSQSNGGGLSVDVGGNRFRGCREGLRRVGRRLCFIDLSPQDLTAYYTLANATRR